MSGFKKATKSQAKLRMAITGPSGSGKTYTSLAVAAPLGRVAVIDTERGSASKYADLFDFDVLELTEYHPRHYIEAIKAAVSGSYDVLIIDSLSHAWAGSGGVLELVDKAAARSQSQNKFTAWRDVTPLHNQLVDAILGSPIHIIATMRSKTEYVLEPDSRNKMQPRKVGLAPVQREGMEYEFDLVGEMDMDNNLIVSKSRIIALTGGVVNRPDAQFGELLRQWLSDGEPLHWALNGAGDAFNQRMKELNLQPAYVLASLEPGRQLARLTDITLTEAEAFARLEVLGEQVRGE